MTLPTSGVITFNDLKTEWSDTNPVSLSEFYAGGTYVGANAVNVPSSGRIDLSDLYGVSNMWTSGITGTSQFLPPIVDSQNNIYFCRRNDLVGTTLSILLLKFNSNGVLQWQYQYATSPAVGITVSRIQKDSNDNIYIGGYGYNINVSGRTDALLIKVNSSGAFQWARSFRLNSFAASPARNTIILDMGLDSSNNIYVSGNYVTADVNNIGILHVTKIDTNGNIQWYRALELFNSFGNRTTLTNTCIAVDGSGNSYSSGSSTAGVPFIKYNSSGSLVTFVGNAAPIPAKMVFDGNGYINGVGNFPGAYQLDSSFNLRWAVESPDTLDDVFLDSSNNIYITSREFSGNFFKLNNNGVLQWARLNKANVGGSDFGYGVYGGAVDSFGNLYTGMFVGNSPQYAFIKKYPSNAYLPVSSVNVFTISGPLTYKYQTSNISLVSRSYSPSAISYNSFIPDIFNQYSNTFTATTAAFTPLRINSAY